MGKGETQRAGDIHTHTLDGLRKTNQVQGQAVVQSQVLFHISSLLFF